MLILAWFSLKGKLPVTREPMESLLSEINLDPPILFPTMTSQYYSIFPFQSNISSHLPTLPPSQESDLNELEELNFLKYVRRLGGENEQTSLIAHWHRFLKFMS